MRKEIAAGLVVLGLAVGSAAGVLPIVDSESATSFSFQQAYDAAAPGAVIRVPAGQVVADAPARGSATIFGGSKQVTFECQDANGLVTIPAAYPRLTIKASNVTLRGSCFRLRDLWIGEPGDSARTASNVLVDGVHMQGLEIVGAQATVRNSEVGPNVLCYAQSSSKPTAMKCDPNGPAHEADYAARGSDDLSFQPFFHNNSGGVRSQVVFENNWVHDVQTKDADGLHTGCGLVWQPSGGSAPLGEITIRGNRYERCAVLGILFSATDGVILENNWMGPPVEPLSNPNGGQVAGTFAKEITARDLPGYDKTRRWRVTNNTLCHGTRAGQPAEDVVFEGNDLGVADAPWAGATYVGNTNVGASCSGSPPPPPPPPTETSPPPPPPPPTDTTPVACNPPVLDWTNPTRSTITVTWQAVAGAHTYRLFKNGTLVATAGPAATSTRFGNLPYGPTVLGVETVCSASTSSRSELTTVETRTAS